MIPQNPIEIFCDRCELLTNQPLEIFCFDCDEEWHDEWAQKQWDLYHLDLMIR